MSVAPFPFHEAYDPEAIEIMSSALAKVCAELGLSDRSDRMTELVAQRIFEAVEKGMQTEAGIHQFVFEKFKSSLP